jgi:uncharacterized protein YceH (UPF0502 family)
MNVTEPEILTAIDALKHLSLVIESSARVPRFEQNINRVLGIPSQASALLATLFLRGPQTAAELRLNSARLHSFADISSVEAFLEELAAAESPLVTKLRRAPGARENRWVHLLCGEVIDEPSANEISAQDAIEPRVSPSGLEDLRVKQMQLEAEVNRLRKQVEFMATQLGIAFEDDSRHS